MQAEAEGFHRFWIALEIPQQVRQAKGGLVVAGLIAQQQPQLALRFGSVLVLQQRHRQVVARFSKGWEQINGLPVETQSFGCIAKPAAGIARVKEHIGRQESSSLSSDIGIDGGLVLTNRAMGQTLDVGEFTGMGMALQAGGLLNHLLKALLIERVIEVTQPCFWGVVIGH